MDRRTKTWRELARMTPSVEEALAEDIDGTLYIGEREPRCAVCAAVNKDLPFASEVTTRVNSLLVKGMAYASIQRAIEPLMVDWPEDQRISYWSIRNHQRRHLHVDDLVAREIIERRAHENGRRILDGAAPLVTHGATLELIVQKGLQAMRRDKEVPTVRDVIVASEKLDQLEAAAKPTFQDDTQNEFEALVQAVSEVAPELWPAIMQRAKQLDADEQGDVPAAGTGAQVGEPLKQLEA